MDTVIVDICCFNGLFSLMNIIAVNMRESKYIVKILR